MRILRIICSFFVVFTASGQVHFFKLYSDNGDETGEGVVQLEDDSYMVTGSSSSFNASGSQLFLLHVDSLGNYLWSNHYGGAEAEGGRRVLRAEDGGFYLAGYMNSIGAGGYDFYLVKTDENGNQQWEKAYGGSGWERVHDAAIAGDNGVIMVGETSSNATNNTDGYIVRTNSTGDTLWTHVLGSQIGEDYLSGIEAVNDSIFYVVGRTYIEDSSQTKALVLKMHEDGTILRSDTLGSHGEYGLNAIHFNGTQIMAVGERKAPETGVVSEYFYVLDTQSESVIIQYHNNHTEGISRAVAVTSYGDSSRRYLGYQYFNQFSFSDGYDASISRTNEYLSWQGTAVRVNYPMPDEINELIPTSDGGAIGVGKTNSEGEGVGVHHVYLAKIGPNELYPNTVVPHDMNQLVSVQEVWFDDQLLVYPNPASDLVNIEIPESLHAEVSLVDASGRVVYNQRAEGKMSISVTGLSPGFYYLKTMVVTAQKEGLDQVQKVLITH